MDDWTAALAFDELQDRRPAAVTVDGTQVLLVRNGDDVFAIGNRCTHMGAPLARGPVTFAGSLRTVRCPLHGSTFDLTTGKVMKGPATEPEPAFETRVSDGVAETRGAERGSGASG